MRLLLVGGWHHFAFLLISAALLGFGASGTLLVFGRAWALRHAEGLLFALLLATAAAMPLSTGLAQHIPVESRVVLGSVGCTSQRICCTPCPESGRHPCEPQCWKPLENR